MNRRFITLFDPHQLTFRFGSSLYNLDSGLEAQILRQLVEAAEDRRQFEAIFKQRESASREMSQVITCSNHGSRELISLLKGLKKETSAWAIKFNDLH